MSVEPLAEHTHFVADSGGGELVPGNLLGFTIHPLCSSRSVTCSLIGPLLPKVSFSLLSASLHVLLFPHPVPQAPTPCGMPTLSSLLQNLLLVFKKQLKYYASPGRIS